MERNWNLFVTFLIFSERLDFLSQIPLFKNFLISISSAALTTVGFHVSDYQFADANAAYKNEVYMLLWLKHVTPRTQSVQMSVSYNWIISCSRSNCFFFGWKYVRKQRNRLLVVFLLSLKKWYRTQCLYYERTESCSLLFISSNVLMKLILDLQTYFFSL